MPIDCCQALIKTARGLNLHLTWLMLQWLSICAGSWITTIWEDPCQTLWAVWWTCNLCEWWAMHVYLLLSGTHQDCIKFEFAFDMADAPITFNLCRDLSKNKLFWRRLSLIVFDLGRYLQMNQLSGSIPGSLGNLVKLWKLWVMSYAWLLIAVRHSSRVH